MTYMSASEIKSLARGKMLGKYNTASAAFVLVQIIVFVVGLIVRNAVDTTSLFGTAVFGIVSIIIELIMVVFLVGELTIYLNFACGNNAKVSDIFSYFKVHPDKAIMMELMIFFKVIVWSIPMGIGIAVMSIDINNIVFVIAGALIELVGAVIMIMVAINLSQGFYLLLDFPQYTVKELLTFSKEIMKGHRGTFVKLYLSFIPYYILAVASMGIGMLFVYPYTKMALTEFYLDIIKEPAGREEEPVSVDEAVPVVLGGNIDMVVED